MFEVLESIPINHDPINSIMLQYEHLLITSMPIMKEEKKQGMFTNDGQDEMTYKTDIIMEPYT